MCKDRGSLQRHHNKYNGLCGNAPLFQPIQNRSLSLMIIKLLKVRHLHACSSWSNVMVNKRLFFLFLAGNKDLPAPLNCIALVDFNGDDDSSYSDSSEDDSSDCIDSNELGHMHIAHFVANENFSDVSTSNLLKLLNNAHVRGLKEVMHAVKEPASC